MKITKAVIPCGGLGTRFYPITKAVPKEILPVIDTPSLHYIINEAAASGITDIMLILSPNKEIIKDYVSKEINNVNIVYAYQNEPKGSADAVYKAKSFTGKEPFCLAWGDDIIDAETPVMKQLMDAFADVQSHIVGVQYWSGDDIIRYGVAKLGKGNNPPMTNRFESKLFLAGGFLEKPQLKDLPSRYAALGRYLLTNEIYDEIEITKAGKNGELQLTDAINSLCIKSQVFGYDFDGKRYDCGDKLGFIKAVIELGLKREFGKDLIEYLREVINYN